jgi:glycosyltransferase involved in cell wall biosynthesis
MKRIAYIINSVEGGGAALPAPTIIGLLRREGFAVTVLALTRRDGRALPAFDAAGIEVRVRGGGERDHGAALRWLLRQLEALRPDFVWTSLTRATLLGQLAARGTPVVSWQHAAFLKPANRLLLRAMQHRSALWLADSAEVAALTSERLGVARERLMIWPLFAADPKAPQARPWRAGQPVRIGSLGRLHRVKGYDVLIDALGELGRRESTPPLAASIAGEGDQRAALAALAEAQFPALELPGFMSDPEAFLAGLHLYVQPSRSEGLCVAAHQAMAAGLPVIASSVVELRQSITDEVGRLVAPGDPAALRDALAALVADPGALAAMGRAARARVLDRFGPAQFEAAGLAVVRRLRAILGE